MTGPSPRPRRAFAPRRRFASLLAVAAVVAAFLVPQSASAAPASPVDAVKTAAVASAVDSAVRPMGLEGFTPGNIISDDVFFNNRSMTEAEIDAFIRSKVASCTSGYTCLKDFRMSTPTRPADSYCDGYAGAANESAARIIYKASQSCGINPQVLLVMLQKEQGLITHTWPSQWRYDMALGQGCPDDAPCDPQFAGFFYQIYGAARQMNIYTEGYWFTYFAPGYTWQVQYHPNRGCGTGPVYMENAATSALYYYTPYQPNAAALRAGYGEGDSCSSYGNRNFYNYFTDWFGSTQDTSGSGSLRSPNTSSYITTVDSAGDVWAYPVGPGASAARSKLATGVGGATVMMVGDLDGDGTRDALMRNGASVMVMYGSPGGLTNAKPLAVDWSNVVLATAAGDMSGDGVPDVLTTDKAGTLHLWRGDNRGGFLPPIVVGWGWGGMTTLIGNIDMSGDGNLDLVARDSAGRLWVYYGNSRGGWVGSKLIGTGWGNFTSIFSAGDFDGDGWADLLATDTAGNLLHYYGQSWIGLTGPVRVGTGWTSMRSNGGAGPAAGVVRPLQPGTGDMDLDGAVDVTALAGDGSVTLYRGDGAGSWRGTLPLGSGWSAADNLLPMGDFNGDGFRDLGRVTPSGDFYLYPGTADKKLGAPVKIGNGWHTLGLLISGIDFDGDRIPDVLARTSSGELTMYPGNGKGGWKSGAVVIGYGWSGFDAAFNVGDFDGDGRSDLLARTPAGALWLFPTTGSGSWGNARQIGNGWGMFSSLIGPGDFDGNGTVDVLARTPGGDLYLYRGNGAGSWGASNRIGWGWQGFVDLG
ncbi:hypothetical protein JOD62_000513 [Microbacterium keratanolyticum]|nr:VCBS repeat-containing protein [Microbacterium keratanolyticum]MBM7467965.1 hypothetical protein [Microbacterium keratanolyticum]